MTTKKYNPYFPEKKLYPLISKDLQRTLNEIEPSKCGKLKLWPCSVALKDSTVISNVYFTESHSYMRYWGVWPEDDDGKKSIDILEVAEIFESPNRLPVKYSNKLYSAGESGMGYIVFKIIFSDGLEQPYLFGGAIDFIKLPLNKSFSDIVEVVPHEGRNSKNLLNGEEYFWCLYSKKSFFNNWDRVKIQ